MVNPDKTRFTAPRAERTDGETFVFDKGIYTACEPCKDNPEKPPLWQVRAAKIIHKKSEQTIYYEDATLELLGIPVAYLPYFWMPRKTLQRRSNEDKVPYLDWEKQGYIRATEGDRAHLQPDQVRLRRRRLSSTSASPTMPRRKNITQNTNTKPSTTWIGRPDVAR